MLCNLKSIFIYLFTIIIIILQIRQLVVTVPLNPA